MCVVWPSCRRLRSQWAGTSRVLLLAFNWQCLYFAIDRNQSSTKNTYSFNNGYHAVGAMVMGCSRGPFGPLCGNTGLSVLVPQASGGICVSRGSLWLFAVSGISWRQAFSALRALRKCLPVRKPACPSNAEYSSICKKLQLVCFRAVFTAGSGRMAAGGLPGGLGGWFWAIMAAPVFLALVGFLNV